MENSTGQPTTALPQSEDFSLLENKLQDQLEPPICVPLNFLKAITNGFSDEQELGRGGFGVVYKGILKNGKVIAVKKLITEMRLDDDQFLNEVTYLIGLNHQNIVKLVGYCAESSWEVAPVREKYVVAEVPKRMLCFQYINNKSLDKHISVPTTASDGFGWRTRYDIIIGICSGLRYLHTECKIVHLDLKPQNILLDDNMEPKIADFGMSRLFGEQHSRIITESRGGTPGYMAPEYLANGLISNKNDIFSLGVIIMELMTGCRDYPSTKESYGSFVENVVGSWRKKVGGRYVEQVKMCIFMGLMCVDTDPNKRPTAHDIVEKLTKQDVMNVIKGPPEKQGKDPSPSVPLEPWDVAPDPEQVCPKDGAGTSEDLSPSDRNLQASSSISRGGQHQRLFKEAARNFKDGMAMVKKKIQFKDGMAMLKKTIQGPLHKFEAGVGIKK